MSDDIEFSPEFSKSIKSIAGAFKGIEFPPNEPLNSSPLFESIVHQHNFLKDIEIPRNPTFDLIEKQEEANGLLNKIVENTSILKELVEINRETQLKTEELTYVMRAIYEVAKANSKEESDTLFAEALKVINESGEAAGNIASLTSLLMGIYTTVNTMI